MSNKFWQSKAFDQFLPWAVPIFLLILWQISSKLGWLSTRILPAPSDVVQTFLQLLSSGELLRNISISTGRALLGFVIGGGIGFILGLLNGLFVLSEKLTDTSLQMLRNIPHLALIPLVIIWFGIGEPARVFLVALGVFFPVYINTFYGIRNVDKGLVEMGKVYGLNNAALFWEVIFPGALPSILVGVRFALGIMWLTLIVAETIASNSGLGFMAMTAREFMRTDVVVLSILIYALLGKLADIVAGFLEKKFLSWHPSYQLTSKTA